MSGSGDGQCCRVIDAIRRVASISINPYICIVNRTITQKTALFLLIAFPVTQSGLEISLTASFDTGTGTCCCAGPDGARECLCIESGMGCCSGSAGSGYSIRQSSCSPSAGIKYVVLAKEVMGLNESSSHPVPNISNRSFPPVQLASTKASSSSIFHPPETVI